MHKDISVILSNGPNHKFVASISESQFRQVFEEFKQTSEWAFFLEFLAFCKTADSMQSPKSHVDKFIDVVDALVAKHSKYSLPLTWPVIYAMARELGEPLF